MEDAQKKVLCRQLDTIDTSLAFLVLLILSVCLSWRAVSLQRQGLCGLLREEPEEIPDLFPLQLTAGALVIGALTFFFGLALDTWQETREQDQTARRSAHRNLWAALFVLAAALIRLCDLIDLQRQQPVLEEELLPA